MEVNKIGHEKKEDDLFDVRYLPEEYMSEEKNDSDDEEKTKPTK